MSPGSRHRRALSRCGQSLCCGFSLKSRGNCKCAGDRGAGQRPSCCPVVGCLSLELPVEGIRLQQYLMVFFVLSCIKERSASPIKPSKYQTRSRARHPTKLVNWKITSAGAQTWPHGEPWFEIAWNIGNIPGDGHNILSRKECLFPTILLAMFGGSTCLFREKKT